MHSLTRIADCSDSSIVYFLRFEFKGKNMINYYEGQTSRNNGEVKINQFSDNSARIAPQNVILLSRFIQVIF